VKGLDRIPRVDELSQCYRILQSGASSISPSAYALWSQWSRFDPRLAEQWIGRIVQDWRRLNPWELGLALQDQPWPAAAGALLSQARDLLIPGESRGVFQSWVDCVMSGIGPAHGEQFFIGLRALGGAAMRADAELTLTSYQEWGYLGREVLINKARPGQVTLVAPSIRRRALDELVREASKQGKALRISEYIAKLNGCVGRRQAELDLRAHPALKALGRTRGRRYRVTS